LIRVFRVFLLGEPLALEGDSRALGFYRNEYVVAFSEEQAVTAAKAKTMRRLESKGAKFIDGKPFVLRVEKVDGSMPPWRLLRNEGFVFFDVDS
jgi:hypothetical protein